MLTAKLMSNHRVIENFPVQTFSSRVLRDVVKTGKLSTISIDFMVA